MKPTDKCWLLSSSTFQIPYLNQAGEYFEVDSRFEKAELEFQQIRNRKGITLLLFRTIILDFDHLSSILIPPRFEDRLCGLVVRVPGYRSRGPAFDSRRYQIF
jgi:hypothetical protein